MACDKRTVKIILLILLAILIVIDFALVVMSAKVYFGVHDSESQKQKEPIELGVLISLTLWLLWSLLAFIFTLKDRKMALYLVSLVAIVAIIVDFVLGVHWLEILLQTVPYILVGVYARLLEPRSDQHQPV